MDWAEGFIAVDWGTTNRRAYLVDGDGKLRSEFEDDRGVIAISRGEFPAAVEEIRARLGDRPLLLGGMAGSTRGWMNAPYLRCPVGLDDLAHALVWPEEGRSAIVPGVCVDGPDRADIMRGEEVQVLGAVAESSIPPDCLVCHPGTHNKWVTVQEGRVADFKTVMTGELFNLLRSGSILSDHVGGDVRPSKAFEEGVRQGLDGDVLTADLFSVRARSLLGHLKSEDSAAFASGLLIGNDLRSGLDRSAQGEVIVMGRPSLTRLYAAALSIAGRTSREFDGERAFLSGSKRIVELMS